MQYFDGWFFPLFLIFDNFLFSFELVFDTVKRWDYSQNISVIGHHDFVKIAAQLNLIDVQTIAWFTMFLSASTFLVATLLAAKCKAQVR